MYDWRRVWTSSKFMASFPDARPGCRVLWYFLSKMLWTDHLLGHLSWGTAWRAPLLPLQSGVMRWKSCCCQRWSGWTKHGLITELVSMSPTLQWWVVLKQLLGRRLVIAMKYDLHGHAAVRYSISVRVVYTDWDPVECRRWNSHKNDETEEGRDIEEVYEWDCRALTASEGRSDLIWQLRTMRRFLTVAKWTIVAGNICPVHFSTCRFQTATWQ
jgi:hypothetical protein